MLLDRRRRHAPAELLDIGGDMHRLDLAQGGNRPALRTSAGTQRRRGVGRASIRVADIDGEEFEEAARAALPGLGDQRRQHDPMAAASVPLDGELAHWRTLSRVPIYYNIMFFMLYDMRRFL